MEVEKTLEICNKNRYKGRIRGERNGKVEINSLKMVILTLKFKILENGTNNKTVKGPRKPPTSYKIKKKK